MKFSTREDIDVPIASVFSMLADFDGVERDAQKRGVELSRIDQLAEPGVGMTWRVRFTWRGKLRALEAELCEFTPHDTIRFNAESIGFKVDGGVTLVALSRQQTRIFAEFDLRPKTLATRLIVQSMKLGKANLTQRFSSRVRSLTKTMEERHQKGEI